MKVEGHFHKVGESSGDEPWNSTFPKRALLCLTLLYFLELCFFTIKAGSGLQGLKYIFSPSDP